MYDDDVDKAVDRVGVLIGEGKMVEEEVTVEWKDKSFRVWISEDRGYWCPDFRLKEDCLSEGVDEREPENTGTLGKSFGGDQGVNIEEKELSVQKIGNPMHGDAKMSPTHIEVKVGLEGVSNFNFNYKGMGNKKFVKQASPKTRDTNGYTIGSPLETMWQNKIRPNKRAREEGFFSGYGPEGPVSNKPNSEVNLEDGEIGNRDDILDSHNTNSETNSEVRSEASYRPTNLNLNRESLVGDNLAPSSTINIVESETQHTVEMGVKVGADLSQHTEAVREVIMEEGNNVCFT